MTSNGLTNALSFDVEDYFQVSALSSTVDRGSWDLRPSRVESNTLRLLELLSIHRTRATFFVLGWIAERHPAVTRAIAAAGHEVACHGYSHELIYRQSRECFREETRRARAVLEEQAQVPVMGYRAASWSITRRSMWALDELVEQGFKYDSSIFPTYHGQYGIPDSPRAPYRIKVAGGGSIVECPPSTVSAGPINLPVAGGGYFRLLPLGVTRWAIRRVNDEGIPFLFYLHPWEIDPEQPRLKAGFVSRFRHYTNLAGCEKKLDALLGEFPMAPIRETLTVPFVPELRAALA